MASVYHYDKVASRNNDPPPNGWPEGMAPNTVNNVGREMMAAFARFLSDAITGELTTAGTASALTLSVSDDFGSTIPTNSVFKMKLHVAPTAGATLTIGTSVARAIVWPDGTALESNFFEADSILTVRASTTQYVIINSGAQTNSDWDATSGVNQILNKPTLGTAASKDVGTESGNVPELDSEGKLLIGVIPELGPQGNTNSVTLASDFTLSSAYQNVLSVSITPTSNTKKIRVWLTLPWAGANNVIYRLLRGTTEILTPQTARPSQDESAIDPLSFPMSDAPASATAVTYHLNARTTGSDGQVEKGATLYVEEQAG